MLIRSPFRDYYDGIQATGVDTSCVYVRRERPVSLEATEGAALVAPWPPRAGEEYDLGYESRSVKAPRYAVAQVRYVGFCGRFIPYVAISIRRHDPDGPYGQRDPTLSAEHFYDLERAAEAIREAEAVFLYQHRRWRVRRREHSHLGKILAAFTALDAYRDLDYHEVFKLAEAPLLQVTWPA